MNLLILFPRYLYECKMSIVRRSVIRELLKRPGTHLSGQGWPDYRLGNTLQENIDRLMPECRVVFAYKPLGGKDFPALGECRKVRQPLILAYNEMWDVAWTTQEIVESGCKLAICHHENDVPKYRHVAGCRFAHIPHCADPELFSANARPWAERDIDFLLTGVLSPQIYPLRERFANLIRTKKIPGVIHCHPGYRLASLAACDRQAVEYAKLLGRAKVSLCCTSRYRYALAKIVESAMAGCCVVSDEPEQESFSRLVFRVDSHAPDDSLVESLQRALAAGEEASATYRSAAWNFTTSRYVDRFT